MHQDRLRPQVAVNHSAMVQIGQTLEDLQQ